MTYNWNAVFGLALKSFVNGCVVARNFLPAVLNAIIRESPCFNTSVVTTFMCQSESCERLGKMSIVEHRGSVEVWVVTGLGSRCLLIMLPCVLSYEISKMDFMKSFDVTYALPGVKLGLPALISISASEHGLIHSQLYAVLHMSPSAHYTPSGKPYLDRSSPTAVALLL